MVKKKTTMKYNVQKLNDIEISVEKITNELQNVDKNQISDSTGSNMMWNNKGGSD